MGLTWKGCLWQGKWLETKRRFSYRNLWLCRVFCEEVFSAEAQRGCAATKRIGIFPVKMQSMS